tara:strand:- start:896 stop:1618 length:723 start_codon:yes stop_codon:yes gene_type:complete
MTNTKDIAKFDKMFKTHNQMTDDHHNGFRKEGLEFLKKRYNKTTDDFIKDTYPKKDQANMRVKISRLINKPSNAPGYFGAIELANDLSKYFNKHLINGDYHIHRNYFLGRSAYVPIVGTSHGNAQIRMFKKSEIKIVAVPSRYQGYHAIDSQNALSRGMIRLFKPRNFVYPGADNRWGLAQDKKSKIIWVGGIEPRSNGRYDILDKSAATGKTMGVLAEDISLAWSTRIEQASFPTYWDY